ncbi:MAG: hypothetical protein ACRD0R_17300, partial [Acidimicrobiales bacterium]
MAGNLVAMARDDDEKDRGDGIDLDAAIAALYGGPLPSFVAERAALARALRAAGRRDAAAAVQALRKPKALAWALDAAAQAAPAAVDELVAAVDEVGAAQASGGDVRAALARLRDAEGTLVGAARDAAGSHDQAVDPTALALG